MELAGWLERPDAPRPRRGGARGARRAGADGMSDGDHARRIAVADHRRRRLHRHQPRRTVCCEAARRVRGVRQPLARRRRAKPALAARQPTAIAVDVERRRRARPRGAARAPSPASAGVPLRRAGGGHHQPRRSAAATSRSTRAARSTCSRRCATLADPPPLVFTSTNKVYGALDDVALVRDARPLRAGGPDDAADTASASSAAARLPQPVRLLEGRGRPVRARLRAHLRPAGGGVPHELHLRPAPVRHRRPGLGRALPDPRARRASRSPSTATACRCATSCSSTIWSTRSCCAQTRIGRARGRGVQHRRRPANDDQPARAARRASTRCTASAPALDFEPGAPADQRYYVSRHRASSRARPAGRRESASPRACGALARVAAHESRGASRATPLPSAVGVMKFALVNPRWSFDGSIYFGCREPHLPLEYGYAQALLEARRARGRDLRRAARRPVARRASASRVAAFAPDFDGGDDRAELPVLAVRAAGAARPAGDGRATCATLAGTHRRRRPARLDDARRRRCASSASTPR